jgi:hypothetical protein
MGSNTIGRANLDGTAVNQSFISGTAAPLGVAVLPEPGMALLVMGGVLGLAVAAAGARDHIAATSLRCLGLGRCLREPIALAPGEVPADFLTRLARDLPHFA